MSVSNATSFGHQVLAESVQPQSEHLLVTLFQVKNFDDTCAWLHPLLVRGAGGLYGVAQWVAQHSSWSTGLILLLSVLLAANLKSLPLVYHLRILNGIRHMLRSQRPDKPITPEQLFQPLIISSRAPLMEIDVFGHKSNSTYFADIDIARAHFISTMFSAGIDRIRGSVTMNGLSGQKHSGFTVPLGGVCCTFRQELKPYEPYDMWTRILSWDEKWIYLVTHFVKKNANVEPNEMTLYPRQNSVKESDVNSRQSSVTSLDNQDSAATKKSPIAASAISKIVFKDGRITIAPEVMLEAAGLLPDTNTAVDRKLAEAQIEANEDLAPHESVSEVEKVRVAEHTGDPEDESIHSQDADTVHKVVLRNAIEAERVRGLQWANMLGAQTGLEQEMKGSVALGRHFDGHGIEGVVATLLQLGKLSSYQLL